MKTKLNKRKGRYRRLRKVKHVTICIGAICEKRSTVIMISDAMITSEFLSIKFEHKTPKLIEISDNCVVATAGDALAHTELFDFARAELDKLKSPTVSEVVECIKACYSQLRLIGIVENVLSPLGFPDFETFYQMQKELLPDIAMTVQGEIENYSVGGEGGLQVLIGGVDSTGGHLHIVDNPGTSVSFDSIGYNAIGSGLPHAMTTFISKGYYDILPLNQALLIAYDAKKISEKAPGVGGITYIDIVKSGKGIITFNEDDIKELDSIYSQMKKAQEEFAQKGNWASELDGLLNRLDRRKRK